MGGNQEGARKAAETARQKHGADFHAKNGAKGGSVKTAKGFSVTLKNMTDEQRQEFYRKRNERRWGGSQ